MSLGMTHPPPPPQSLGEGLQVKIFDKGLHTVMVTGKCTDVFRGDFFWVWMWSSGEGAIWEDLSLEEYFVEEEKFNEKGAGFSSITIKQKKNNENINMKKFFQLKVRRSIKI